MNCEQCYMEFSVVFPPFLPHVFIALPIFCFTQHFITLHLCNPCFTFNFSAIFLIPTCSLMTGMLNSHPGRWFYASISLCLNSILARWQHYNMSGLQYILKVHKLFSTGNFWKFSYSAASSGTHFNRVPAPEPLGRTTEFHMQRTPATTGNTFRNLNVVMIMASPWLLWDASNFMRNAKCSFICLCNFFL